MPLRVTPRARRPASVGNDSEESSSNAPTSRRAAGTAALALTLLAGGAATAAPSPVTATIRVEGLPGTVIPTTTLPTDARPVVSDDNVAHQLGAPSALTLLADAAAANGAAVSCTWSTTYSDCLVNVIGAAFPTGATDYWRLVVNGKDAPSGSPAPPCTRAIAST